MKKSSFLLFLIIPFLAISQTGFKIGPSASYLMSRLTLIDTISNQFSIKNHNGFNAGAYFSYGITDRAGLNLRTLVTMKGFRLIDYSNGGAATLNRNEFNIEFPMHFYLKQKLNAGTIIRENIGISYNGTLGNKPHLLSPKNNQFHIKQSYNYSHYAMVSVGLEAGNVNKNGNVFLFGVFYKHSLSDANSLTILRNKEDTNPLFKLNNRGGYISVGVSYLFNIDFKNKDEYFY